MATNIDGSEYRGTTEAGGGIDVPGVVMRVRRSCDLSQRQLAAAIGLDQSQVVRIEGSRRRVDVALLARIVALAGCRIAILDRDGVEVAPVPGDVLRDNGERRMPAHLDVQPPSVRSASAMLEVRADRPQPLARYHHRVRRDRHRAAQGLSGAPEQPTYRDVARVAEGRRTERTRFAQERAATLLDVDCTCGDECWTRGRCEGDCPCRCE